MDVPSNSNKRIAKNSIFLSLRMVVVMFISFFTTRYLLKNLGIEDYGIYNVTLGIVALCTFLIPTLTNANQRFHSFELGKNGENGAQSVFNTGIHIQLVMIIIVLLICETLGLWYIEEKLAVPAGREFAAFCVYQISVAAIAISMLQIPYIACILAHEHMNFYAIINLLDAFLKFLIAIFIAFSSYDKLVFYGFLMLTINLLNFCLYCGYSHYHFKEIKFKREFRASLFKEMISFSGWNLFETIARIGKDQGGNLILNFYFGPVLNAARGIANQVSYAFTSLVESTIMASRPQLVKSYAKGKICESLSIFNTLSKGVLLIIYIFSLPVFLEVDIILNLWLGDNIPDYTLDFVRLSILIILIDKLATPVTAIIHATGKIRNYHLLSGFINILVIPISYYLISEGCGPVYVYVSTLCAAIVAQYFFIVVIASMLPYSLKEYGRQVILPFIKVFFPSCILPVLFHYILETSICRLFIVSFLSLLFGMLSTYIWGLKSSERSVIMSLLKKK